MSGKSLVWNYFKKEGNLAVCQVNKCKKQLKFKATSSLFYHLKHFHKISIQNLQSSASQNLTEPEEETVEGNRIHSSQEAENQEIQSQEGPKAKRQKTIQDCFPAKSLEETVAKMITLSNLSVRQVTRTEFIHRSLQKEFPQRNVPKSENGTVKLVEDFFAKENENLKVEIGKALKNGTKFSLTLDEWTSQKNKRYLNINIHHSIKVDKTIHRNLGMIEIKQSCPASVMKEMVRNE